MKRYVTLTLALLLVLMTAGCGASSSSPAAPSSAAPAVSSSGAAVSSAPADASGFKPMEDTYLTMASGSSGGGWYIMGAGLNDAFEELLPAHMTMIPGGGSTNPTLVNDGKEVQVGFTYIANAKAAVAGQFDYEGQKCDNLRALCCLNVVQYLTVCATPDSGFKSITDMINNPTKLKIAVGPRGGGNEILLNRLLESYGTSLDALSAAGASVQYISAAEGMSAIKDGQVNVVNYMSSLPLTSLVETLASMKLNFIGLDKAESTKACDKYGYSYQAIPAGTYDGQAEDVYTLSDTVILVVNSEMKDEVAYNLAKIISENEQRWRDVHASFDAFDPQKAAETGIVLHSGAESYYKEAGLL